MTLRQIVFAAMLCCAAAAVAAQNMKIQPIQMKPTAAATAIDEGVLLRTENQKLREQNARLEAENQQLKAQLEGYRMLGGSQVHAYCTNDNTTSRNTAGTESQCAPSGYNCEPVSGLCRTSCAIGPDCAVGFTCDTGAGKCVRTG